MSTVVIIGDQRRKKEAIESLITDITKGRDDNVSASIRIAIERGWLDSMMDSLNDAKKRKDIEIDKICSKHYNDFLQSVQEMLKIKGSSVELIDLVSEINSDLNTSG
eukprot:gene17333-22878_t